MLGLDTEAASRLPPSRVYVVPGVGMGWLIAQDGATAVAVTSNDGGSPFVSTAHIVDVQTSRVVGSVPLASDVVVAAIDAGVVYLFDDKIGYWIRASDGELVRDFFESDNYRGQYTAAGVRHLQTSAEITTINLDGRLFGHLELAFEGIAYGCFFGS